MSLHAVFITFLLPSTSTWTHILHCVCKLFVSCNWLYKIPSKNRNCNCIIQSACKRLVILQPSKIPFQDTLVSRFVNWKWSHVNVSSPEIVSVLYFICHNSEDSSVVVVSVLLQSLMRNYGNCAPMITFFSMYNLCTNLTAILFWDHMKHLREQFFKIVRKSL